MLSVKCFITCIFLMMGNNHAVRFARNRRQATVTSTAASNNVCNARLMPATWAYSAGASSNVQFALANTLFGLKPCVLPTGALAFGKTGSNGAITPVFYYAPGKTVWNGLVPTCANCGPAASVMSTTTTTVKAAATTTTVKPAVTTTTVKAAATTKTVKAAATTTTVKAAADTTTVKATTTKKANLFNMYG